MKEKQHHQKKMHVASDTSDKMHQIRSAAAKKAAVTRKLHREKSLGEKAKDAGYHGASAIWETTKNIGNKIKEALHL